MIESIDTIKIYDNGTRALKGVNLRIEDGEFVFIRGASGSGKSKLTKLMMREELRTFQLELSLAKLRDTLYGPLQLPWISCEQRLLSDFVCIQRSQTLVRNFVSETGHASLL